MCRKHNVIVLSDEIYSELHYQGKHESMAHFYPDGTIISNGISKWAGAGGWRLGFFVFPDALKPVLDSMIVIASETFTSVSAPIQMAAISAFEGSTEMHQYIQASRNIMRTTGTVFSKLLQQQGIDVVMPEGGFYNLPDFSNHKEKLLTKGITSATELCRQMLKQTGVAGLPGSDFGLSQGFLVRFAFVDFDGTQLIHRVLENPALVLDDNTPELQHLFSAAQRIGQWLDNL